MKPELISDRARLKFLAVGKAGRSAVDHWLKSPFYRWRFGGTPADHLLLVPQDLRTADPSFAAEIDHGHFGLAGAIGKTDSQSPFNIQPPNKVWERELYGFSWLRHLRASRDEQTEELCRILVIDWINRSDSSPDICWKSEVVARRIMSWLYHAPLFLGGASQEEYDKIMWSLTKQMRLLASSWRDAPNGLPRLTVLIALILIGLCVGEQENYVTDHVRPFTNELKRQILADGGHVSRNPSVLVDLLLDLLPLKQCFVARDRRPPDTLLDVIWRMIPMLRFMRLGDGNIARFNGVSETLSDEAATVLAYEDFRLRRFYQAEHSGYCRLERGETAILMDTGKPPPLHYSSEAHAGCLSFEMSVSHCPLVINCGAPGTTNQEWRVRSRATASHSTLTVSETSSSRLLQSQYLDQHGSSSALSGPAQVETKYRREKNQLDLQVSHDGYVDRFGLSHIRRLVLSNDGSTLNGEDQLFTPTAIRDGRSNRENPFAVRFHIHPSVRVTRSEDGTGALFDLPNKEQWRLEAKDYSPRLEESLFLADYRGPRRCLQVVFRGICKKEMRLNWQIQRVDKETHRPKRIMRVV